MLLLFFTAALTAATDMLVEHAAVAVSLTRHLGGNQPLSSCITWVTVSFVAFISCCLLPFLPGASSLAHLACGHEGLEYLACFQMGGSSFFFFSGTGLKGNQKETEAHFGGVP